MTLTQAHTTSDLQAYLQAAGTGNKRDMLHSFRVGGAASDHVDGTAMDVFMEYVGWRSPAVAGRYAGATALPATSRKLREHATRRS